MDRKANGKNNSFLNCFTPRQKGRRVYFQNFILQLTPLSKKKTPETLHPAYCFLVLD